MSHTFPWNISDRTAEWLDKKRAPGYVRGELGRLEADITVWRRVTESEKDALEGLIRVVEHHVDTRKLPGVADKVRAGHRALRLLREALAEDEEP